MSDIPIFDSILDIKIHPALDFKEKGYVGVFLPTEGGNEEMLFIVTSDREIISTNEELLKQKNIKLSHKGVKFSNQWSSISLQDFLKSFTTVDKKDIFEEVEGNYEYYIDFLDKRIYNFLSLWVIGTYLFPIFKTYPYIYIGGVKESGKTKTLYLTSLMSFNSIFSSNMSTSSIFRLIQNGRCTLFIDESEKLVNPERAQEFRSILLQGYKSGSKVFRSEKNFRDKFVVESFEVYSPKIIANIFGIEDVIGSRCIRIIMQRTTNKEIGDREIDETNNSWQCTRDKLYNFAMNYWKDIKDIYETIPNETSLSNRDWELWKPILSIASFINKELYEEIKNLAEEKSREKHIENVTETGECVLVEALLELVKSDEFYKVKEIRVLMESKYDEEQKWLKSEWIGRALGRLGFAEKRRMGSGTEYKFTIRQIRDVANRLGLISHTELSLPSQPTDEGNQGNECNESMNYNGICESCGKHAEVKKSNGKYICKTCITDDNKV